MGRIRLIQVMACAWVLWEVLSSLQPSSIVQEPRQAQAIQHACEEEKQDRLSRSAGVPHARVTDNMVMFEKDGRLVTTIEYRCFPDTIDPRR